MTPKEVIKTIENYKGPNVKFAITDVDGVLRSKTLSKAKMLTALDEGIGFCNVIFGWDVNDSVYNNTEVTGWHTGYPDSTATIDASTFRTIPWEDNRPFLLADFSASQTLGDVCPRTLLKKVKQKSLDHGYIPQFASEFEWFNFQETTQTLTQKNFDNPVPLSSGMFGYSMLRSSQNAVYFDDIHKKLMAFGVPIEGLHTETGEGVYEASIEYDDVLEAADRATLFKTGVKEIAYQHEITASFMAKWSTDFPGCGAHIHQSLWNGDNNENMFFDDSNEHHISALMEQYIAGQLYCLPHILPMYAPTVNSYKRLVAGSWASTSVSWGIDNRTTALRVINHPASSTRLETRVPGADANPYLAMAAGLASGLYGIEHELSLEIPPTKGNEYQQKGNKPLPSSLKEATDAMKASDIAKELFGKSFTTHFIKTREWEWQQFLNQVTHWELKRYFEII